MALARLGHGPFIGRRMQTYPEPRCESRVPFEGDPELPKTITFAVVVIALFVIGVVLMVRGLA